MKLYALYLGFLSLLGSACSSIPSGAKAVSPFEIQKYMGTWYEIARMDFRFERNLNNTTAQYTLLPNGKVQVVNKGYNYVTNTWKQAEGIAKFRGDENTAQLKVSFFRPFWGAYNVIALDADYTYAFVAGKNLDYMWILSRHTSIPQHIKLEYLALADSLGFATNELIWVEHTK